MELQQNDLFQTGTTGTKKGWDVPPVDAAAFQEGSGQVRTEAAASIDGHMADLISDYIARLPDNATRKHVARQLINFIIKSANL